MSHEEFIKLQCPLSLFLQFPCQIVDFEIVCRMSNLGNGPCHVANIFRTSINFMSPVDLRMSMSPC